MAMIPEDQAIQDEEKDPGVAEKGQKEKQKEKKPDQHQAIRWRIGPMSVSGTRTLPSVSVFFTLP